MNVSRRRRKAQSTWARMSASALFLFFFSAMRSGGDRAGGGAQGDDPGDGEPGDDEAGGGAGEATGCCKPSADCAGQHVAASTP